MNNDQKSGDNVANKELEMAFSTKGMCNCVIDCSRNNVSIKKVMHNLHDCSMHLKKAIRRMNRVLMLETEGEKYKEKKKKKKRPQSWTKFRRHL